MSLLDDLPPEDKKILEKILITIRDKCPAALEAITHLETKTGKKATQALNNIRDVLFHFATTVRELGKSTETIKQQLGPIEEHFRRAIIEPYEHAANIRAVELDELWENYLETVFPITHKLNPCPTTTDEQKGKINNIKDLIRKGRDAKRENAWTSIWEQGCKAFEKAYDESDKLRDELRAEIARAVGHKRNRRNIMITIGAGFLIALVFFLVGIFLF